MKINIIKSIMRLFLAASLLQVGNSSELKFSVKEGLQRSMFIRALTDATRGLIESEIEIIDRYENDALSQQDLITKHIMPLLEKFGKETTTSLVNIIHELMQY